MRKIISNLWQFI